MSWVTNPDQVCFGRKKGSMRKFRMLPFSIQAAACA
jgi:hypothetical protein